MMIWVPEHPGPRETRRWPGQPRDDPGQGPDGPGWADLRWVPGQAPGQLAGPSAPAGDASGPADAAVAAPAPAAGRPVIGDQLRLASVWCQLYPCIARHADPETLGEADARARAIAAGWREDALGRLTCPDCQQHSAHFWATQPVVRWDRGVAVTMTTLITAASPEDAVGAAGAGTGVLPAALPVPRPFATAVPPPRALPVAVVDEGYWAGRRGGGRHRRRR
jgi:hypothetical protein